ncbi:MAG: hypothetical protein U9P42_07145 [Candidatus Fermentibacteria bacterium]|nr:hypothetical protein [Candidatus Fermentibacteria bacterium]
MKHAVTLFLLFVVAGISLADYQIIATIDAPDTNISGLGYGNGSLWAVDQVTEFAYQVNPVSGAVQNVWFCAENTTRKPSGLTFANNTVYIAAGATSALTDPWCYRYNTSGTYLGCFDLDC